MSGRYIEIEARRQRAGLTYQELSVFAKVPYTRLYMLLAGTLKPDEKARIERVLAERERGY